MAKDTVWSDVPSVPGQVNECKKQGIALLLKAVNETLLKKRTHACIIEQYYLWGEAKLKNVAKFSNKWTSKGHDVN